MCFITVKKVPDKNNLKEGFITVPSDTAHHNTEDMGVGIASSWSHCVYSQESESHECLCSAPFLLPIQSRTQHVK